RPCTDSSKGTRAPDSRGAEVLSPHAKRIKAPRIPKAQRLFGLPPSDPAGIIGTMLPIINESAIIGIVAVAGFAVPWRRFFCTLSVFIAYEPHVFASS